MDEESQHIIDEVHEIEIKDHLDRDIEEECGYCGQVFGPDFVVIERTIHGRKWRFCSEECLRDFQDASNFKDEDLDSKDEQPILGVNTEIVEDEEEEF